MNKLVHQLRREGLLRDGDDLEQLPKQDLLNRRLNHLESVIEGQVAHICALRESVQRVAGELQELF